MTELFKDVLLVILRNTRPGIGHGDPHAGIVQHRGGDDDPPALRREFDGVTQQVIHDLLDFLAVGLNQRKIVSYVQTDLDQLLLGQRRKEGRKPFQQLRNAGLFDPHDHLARLGLGQIEQVVDHVQQ